MVVFPNAKINIGLYVTSTLPNGYHTIETVMVPIGWSDILEVVPARGRQTTLTVTGRKVDCPLEKNLVFRAWQLLHDRFGIGAVDMYLHKIIPDGAGLGGGSADAAFALKALNDLFEIGLGKDVLAELALSLGADCPFFIYNKPMLAEGIGERLTEVNMPEFGGYIVVVKPQRSVSTAQAYSHVEIASPPQKLSDMISLPVSLWETTGIKNCFEQSVSPLLPVVQEIKRRLIDAGAIYASMSGSGSAVYGLFTDDKKSQQAVRIFTDMSVYTSPLLFGTR